MKLPSKLTLGVDAVALILILALYVGDVLDWARARTAAVSAMASLPNIAFALIVLIATGFAVGAALYGISRGLGDDFKGYRLLPIVAVIAVFVDVFVLSADKLPVPSPDQAAMAVDALARAASDASPQDHVLDSERDLSDIVKQFAPPPYLAHGVRVDSYAIQRRENCDGPVAAAPGTQVGTFIYCVAKDRLHAWVTVVALPFEERFGDANVLSRGGAPISALVEPPVPENTGNEGTPGGDQQGEPEPEEPPAQNGADAGS